MELLVTLQVAAASVGVNVQSKWVTMQAYRLAKAYTNSEGITFFPANSYFPNLDYARSSQDQRHHFSLAGHYQAARPVHGRDVTVIA
jgi:hypothetical protein